MHRLRFIYDLQKEGKIIIERTVFFRVSTSTAATKKISTYRKAMKTYKIYFITGAVIVISALAWWFFATIGEFGAPRIDLMQDLRGIGPRTVLEITFSDTGSGLRETAVTLTQDNQPRVLSKLEFSGPKTKRHVVSIPIDPQALKLHDGPATLTVTAADHAL